MNKELLISIKPEHLVNILNGKKTLELRKTVPKDYKGWVNIYCTKSSKNILYKYKGIYYTQHYLTFTDCVDILNGKVVARFWFDEYDTLTYFLDTPYYVANNGELSWKVDSKYIKLLCLDYQDVLDYGFRKKPILHQTKLYAWHIKQLEIFDKPKELSEFYKTNLYASGKIIRSYEEATNDLITYRLQRPPQSYQFVYVKE